MSAGLRMRPRAASSRLRLGDSLPAMGKPIPESPFKRSQGLTASFGSLPPVKYTLCGAALLLIITLQVTYRALLQIALAIKSCMASSRGLMLLKST